MRREGGHGVARRVHCEGWGEVGGLSGAGLTPGDWREDARRSGDHCAAAPCQDCILNPDTQHFEFDINLRIAFHVGPGTAARRIWRSQLASPFLVASRPEHVRSCISGTWSSTGAGHVRRSGPGDELHRALHLQSHSIRRPLRDRRLCIAGTSSTVAAQLVLSPWRTSNSTFYVQNGAGKSDPRASLPTTMACRRQLSLPWPPHAALLSHVFYRRSTRLLTERFATFDRQAACTARMEWFTSCRTSRRCAIAHGMMLIYLLVSLHHGNTGNLEIAKVHFYSFPCLIACPDPQGAASTITTVHRRNHRRLLTPPYSSGQTLYPKVSFMLTKRVWRPFATLWTASKSSSLSSGMSQLLSMRFGVELFGSTT